jgi:hypothetical protein
MTNEEFYQKYPESKKVDQHGDTIKVAEEFAEWIRSNKDYNVDTPDIYKWLGIDYAKYQKEVDQMYKDTK